MLAAATLDTLLGELVLPYLQELGARWERGETSIAHEHFASGVLRGRLLGIARGWASGSAPRRCSPASPASSNLLGLITFGLALRSRGWRIIYLGADTPIETVEQASRQLNPSLVVLTAVSGDRVQPTMAALIELTRRHRVALGGRAADNAAFDDSGILALSGDPIVAAARVTALIEPGTPG